ncbi:protein phosphatase 1 regulatory subunit 1B isoform 1-T1 [Cyanocitta cristata]
MPEPGGHRDMGRGILEPKGCGDVSVGPLESGAWGEGTARAQGTRGHGDTETRMPELRGYGDKGTGLLEPSEHGDSIAGAWGTRGDGDGAAGAGTGAIIPCSARGQGVCRDWDTDCLLPVLPVLAAYSPAGEATTSPRRAVSPSPAGPGDASRTPGRCVTRHRPGPGGAPVPRVPRGAPASSTPARAAPGSQGRAERSYFPAGLKAHKRKGGQKVSFAGGIDEREEDLKSLTVSEIPEDPEGAEDDEEEPGQEQDGGTGERRHVGFAEVPSRPIGTERHSPTYPLGTS